MEEQPLTPFPFIDWYGIWPGHGGVGRDGLSWIQDPPLGALRLAVQQARLSDRLFTAGEHPWEVGWITPNCVLHEEGTLKMWYRCTGDDGIGYVAYAESADGFNWKKPQLGLVEYRGLKANNLLHPGEYFGLYSVFRDPAALPEERYKSVLPTGKYYVDGVPDPNLTKEQFREMRRAMQHEGFTSEKIAQKLSVHQVIIGAVSPDGLRWKVLEEPLRDLGSRTLDGDYVATYDEERGEYVAYHRGHMERRRSVRRSVGKRFDEWGDPRWVFMPDPQDPIDVDVYSSGYCRYPGASLHLMFLPFYHRLTSTVDIQLATSRDGELWSRPERVPIIPRGEYESVYGQPNLVPLSGEEWGILVHGTHARHDFKTDPSDVYDNVLEWRWATWKRDRLVALEAQGEARFTTVQKECRGREMRLNFQTEKGGWVRVELVNPPVTPPAPVEPFAGFGLAEADVLVGDELSRAVTWKGRADLSALKGRQVSIRFHLCRARLYSLSI